ncbi:MAG: TetR family transcriptional regulator [Aquabacterium sp.]|uniref:TetR/AcrR family transcriptional regulator n=1 Tax=Aquabacterium sp. TaxID=1872578 RepID=UPI002716C4A0|nr:TetR family transcriptional regulator [Aquabacterium sp.]MDO9002913.1 TetR family transcriptional regulator [Aquabacterium sp.]
MSKTAPSDPSQPRMAQGKRLLMDTATRLLARQTLQSTLALRELAREAGLNHNTFYRHFSSLEEMQAAIIEEFVSNLRSGLTEARQQIPPGQSVSQVAIGLLFDFARQNSDPFILAYRVWHGPPSESRDLVQKAMDQLCDDMFRDLQALGILPKLDEARLRRLLAIDIQQVFRLCIAYLESPRSRTRLIDAGDELLRTLIAGAVVLQSP